MSERAFHQERWHKRSGKDQMWSKRCETVVQWLIAKGDVEVRIKKGGCVGKRGNMCGVSASSNGVTDMGCV